VTLKLSDPSSLSGGANGQTVLSSTPTSIYNLVGTGAVFWGELGVAIVTATTAFHAFVTLGVHVGGYDCPAGVAAAALTPLRTRSTARRPAGQPPRSGSS